jgi:PAS domain S-box-containing protein
VQESARILVVDDHKDRLHIHSRLLRQAGYRILEAATGSEGLRIAREQRPDLVLLDAVLTDMDGLEVCRRIKADDDLAGTFVLLLSPHHSASDKRASGLEASGLEAGADDHLVFPVPSRLLLARVQAMLRLKRTESELRERTRQLGERVRELDCLYGISRLVDTPGISLPEILQGVVELIPTAWQHPESIGTRIMLDDQVFVAGASRPGASWPGESRGADGRLAYDIVVHGRPVGTVEVCHAGCGPEGVGERFLAGERDLLNAIAEQLGRIVERIRAGRALRESEQRYRGVIANSNDGITLVDAQGKITDWNRGMEQITGLARDEVLGRAYWDVQFQFEPQARKTAALYELIRAATLALLETGQSPWLRDIMERNMQRADGTPCVLQISLSTMETDRGPGLVGIVRDVTDHRRAEGALRESEETYRNLVENVSDIIYALDTQGGVTYVSPAVESVLGYSPAEVVGQPFSRYVAPADVSPIQEAIRQTMSDPDPSPSEFRAVARSGEVHWLRASGRPILDGGRVQGLRGVLTDITSRKQAEAQLKEAATAAERERLARELHDAVTQALFSASLIAETLPRVWERHPEEGRQGLEQLRQLTRGTLAEMRALLLELRPAALGEQDLDTLLRQLVDGMRARTTMDVTTTIRGDCSLPLEARFALYRIAQEALNNVTKHARATQATVSLDCRPELTTLRIRDDGRGFDLGDTRARQMGLRIMRERAQDIGADLCIRSQPGQGTELVVTWPGERQESL